MCVSVVVQTTVWVWRTAGGVGLCLLPCLSLGLSLSLPNMSGQLASGISIFSLQLLSWYLEFEYSLHVCPVITNQWATSAAHHLFFFFVVLETKLIFSVAETLLNSVPYVTISCKFKLILRHLHQTMTDEYLYQNSSKCILRVSVVCHFCLPNLPQQYCLRYCKCFNNTFKPSFQMWRC